MCDSSNLRRDSSWPRRTNSPAIVRRTSSIERITCKFCGSWTKCSSASSALEPDQRLVVSLLVLGDERKIDENTRVRLHDIQVMGAVPPPLQKLDGVHEQRA